MPEEEITPAPAPVDWVGKLTGELQTFQKQLAELDASQKNAIQTKNEQAFVDLYLKYIETEREITDRQHVLTLLQEESRLESDYYRAEFWSYLVAAETVSLDLVNYLADRMRTASAKTYHEYETYDQFFTPYKNYILPGKIIAGKFEELDVLVDEMNHYIMQVIPEYDRSKSLEVLPYAFSMAIDSDTANEPVKQALETIEFRWVMPEEVEHLKQEVEEQMQLVEAQRAQNIEIAKSKFKQA